MHAAARNGCKSRRGPAGESKPSMTFDEARTRRFIYFAGGILAIIFAALFLIVTDLKGIHLRTYEKQHAGDEFWQNALGLIFENVVVVRWLWPWMSDSGFGGMSNFPFSPSAILGWVLLIVGGLLGTNARRLKRWLDDVKELLAKEQMAASRRPASQRQLTGDVHSGRDSHITLTNYYNQRPDNPKIPIIIAIIGVVGTIIAALLK